MCVLETLSVPFLGGESIREKVDGDVFVLEILAKQHWAFNAARSWSQCAADHRPSYRSGERVLGNDLYTRLKGNVVRLPVFFSRLKPQNK